jgi:hypothetical protein
MQIIVNLNAVHVQHSMADKVDWPMRGKATLAGDREI